MSSITLNVIEGLDIIYIYQQNLPTLLSLPGETILDRRFLREKIYVHEFFVFNFLKFYWYFF